MPRFVRLDASSHPMDTFAYPHKLFALAREVNIPDTALVWALYTVMRLMRLDTEIKTMVQTMRTNWKGDMWDWDCGFPEDQEDLSWMSVAVRVIERRPGRVTDCINHVHIKRGSMTLLANYAMAAEEHITYNAMNIFKCCHPAYVSQKQDQHSWLLVFLGADPYVTDYARHVMYCGSWD